jgi:hypothetical protein
VNYRIKNLLLLPFRFLQKICPKINLKPLYQLKTGKKLNLHNLILYNEKIQWIKLYARNPLMPICADKYLVRE